MRSREQTATEVSRTFPILTDLSGEDDNVIRDGGNVIPMGTIKERPRKKGGTAYLAQIVIKRKGKPTYREAQTFDRRAEAVAYLKRREPELKAEGGIERAKAHGLTLADAIDKYVTESLKDIGRTKAQVLETIKKFDIADLDAADVTSSDIVRFARELSKTVKPQTVQNYVSHLSAVFRIAKPAWDIPLDIAEMKAAFEVLKQLGLTAKSDKRDRRPTLNEVDKLMEHFVARNERGRDVVPMERVIAFALFSTRRLGEIVRITWADYDKEGKRVLVRDMKHPGQKRGNDVMVDLPDQAVAIIEAMPRTDARIFPYGDDAIGASFTRACALLGIEDLHFHDLRHEGVSRLFEMGWNIPHVAAVSGHRGWQSLQRYTHLRNAGDRWANWKWLAHVSAKIGE